ncbi:MAG: DUF6049 family protein [Acidimicrobiales bacterium]
MTRWRAAVVVGLLLIMAGVVPVPLGPAAAQQTGSVLRLASQTPWVGPGEELALRLQVTSTEPAADVELAVAVYRRVRSRSEFVRSLDDGPRGNPLTVIPPAPLAELAVDAAGAFVVRLPIQDPLQPLDPSRLRLATEGVYPVRVELREAGGGPALAQLVTHLVHTRPPQPGGFPLNVALVLPVHGAPALQADGRREVDRPTASALGELARSLEANPGVPLTILPTPETLVALDASNREEDQETVAAMARASANRQLAAASYVPLAVAAFATDTMAAEAAIQLDRGGQVIERTLGRRPDPRTWVAQEGLDERAVLRLRQQQVDRFVLPEPRLAPVELTRTLAQPFELGVRAVRRPAALAGDPGLAAHFAPSDDPVLAAHHLLADLAVIHQDSPSRSRAVVALPPRSWRPNQAFLDSLLGGLASSPVVRGATLDVVFADVPAATTGTGGTMVRQLGPPAAGATLRRVEVQEARARLVSFASMLNPDNTVDDRIEELLLLAEGAGLRAAQRKAYLDGIKRRIDSQTAGVQVPSNRSITLTARKGEIPVTVRNTAGYPVRVQLQVASDKLDFPRGAVRSLDLSRGSTTERFSVRARTSGSFPLRVNLVSPDGGLLIGSSRFTVRSTAASGVGLVLSAGAVAFLLLWWGRHLARGRRNRRLVPA